MVRQLRVPALVLGLLLSVAAPVAASGWNLNYDQSPVATGPNVAVAGSTSTFGPWVTPELAFNGVIDTASAANVNPGYGAWIGQWFDGPKDIRRIYLDQSWGSGDINAIAIVCSDALNNTVGYQIVGVYPCNYGANVFDIPSQGAHQGWWVVGMGKTSYNDAPPYNHEGWYLSELQMYAAVASASSSPSPSSSPTSAPSSAPSAVATAYGGSSGGWHTDNGVVVRWDGFVYPGGDDGLALYYWGSSGQLLADHYPGLTGNGTDFLADVGVRRVVAQSYSTATGVSHLAFVVDLSSGVADAEASGARVLGMYAYEAGALLDGVNSASNYFFVLTFVAFLLFRIVRVRFVS